MMNKHVWCRNHRIMANMHELLSIKAHILRESLISLAVCMSIVSTVRMPAAAAQTLNLLVLLRRPHPSMQVNSSCANSPLQWWHPRSVESTTRLWQRIDAPRLSLRSRLGGLLSRPLETRAHGASRCSFENASLWPPLFVHTALQFWPILLNL